MSVVREEADLCGVVITRRQLTIPKAVQSILDDLALTPRDGVSGDNQRLVLWIVRDNQRRIARYDADTKIVQALIRFARNTRLGALPPDLRQTIFTNQGLQLLERDINRGAWILATHFWPNQNQADQLFKMPWEDFVALIAADLEEPGAACILLQPAVS